MANQNQNLLPTYIVVWNGFQGRVLADSDIIFDLDEKPEFSFQYEELNYNTHTDRAHYTMRGTPDVNGATPTLCIGLTDDQIKELRRYSDTFLDTQDYMVYAYDQERIFRGHVLKSQAIAAGLEYTIQPAPDVAFSKWNKSKSTWEPVMATFKEDGYPVFDQDRPMDSDVLFLTRAEWDALPKQPSSVYSLDFKTMTWVDKRDLEQVKFDAIMDVRVYYEHAATRSKDQGRINPSEYPTYILQRTEAEAWLKDNSVKTPFIDGFLSMNNGIDKKSLCERITGNYTYDALFQAGKQHGEMYNYIYRIKAATTNNEVDEIIQEIYLTMGKYRIVNVYRQYPAAFAKQVSTGTELAVFTGGGLYHSSALAD